MHYPILAFLPALAAAADYQITSWLCTPLLDVNEGIEQMSVRDGGQTGCEGYTLFEHDDNWWMGAFSGNPDSSSAFDFGESPNVPGRYEFGATFDHSVRVGTCYEAYGADVCQTFATACAIAVLYDCYLD